MRAPLHLDALPVELRELVRWSVGLLGQVIERETGRRGFRRIEGLRESMARLRGASSAATLARLEDALGALEGLEPGERLEMARAFTLMLELMNACENAYRSHRLRSHGPARVESRSRAIIYVLTAHPTEARSPANIAVFRALHEALHDVLREGRPLAGYEPRLLHLLRLAWRISPVRERAPRVSDEAEHIYEILFEERTFLSLLAAGREIVPVYVRTWVGGDKDGHPGVDEKAMLASLALARGHLLRFARHALREARDTLALLPGRPLAAELAGLARALGRLRRVGPGDGGRVAALRREAARLSAAYVDRIGALHPALNRLRTLLHMFPALVVPLELRESSDVLMKPERSAIDRMLRALGSVASGGDAYWYARGFIVSMAGSIEHLRAAERRMRAALGPTSIPVIPLFEELASLEASPGIVGRMLRGRRGKAPLEVMVGYSDSAKESGALPSRLAIARAMGRLDAMARRRGVEVLFFHGSGGSVDRGGGTIHDQTSWWPRSALNTYKVTVQGEVVERSLAGPEITRGQIERIAAATARAPGSSAIAPRSAAVRAFAGRVSRSYQGTVGSPGFLEAVERATLYRELSRLKFGSRPARRSALSSVKSLRAIPWALCWTQTRVLFPTWWGIGTAWRESGPVERRRLRAAFATEPVYASFVRALGFTLAKVELPVWKLYLRRSGLPAARVAELESLFEVELRSAWEFLRYVTGRHDPLWFRPWLGASIRLRSPMIHPLNLLQILAMRERDPRLLRYTAAGISSGMMTTG